MSTYNIECHDKIRNFSKNLFYSAIVRLSQALKKRVRITHSKRAIGVRAIEVRLYFVLVCGLTPSLPQAIILGFCKQHRSR